MIKMSKDSLCQIIKDGGPLVAHSCINTTDYKLLWLYILYNGYTYNCFKDVSKARDLDQSKFAPVGAPLPGVHVVIMDNEYNIKPIGISGEVKLYFIRNY